MPIHESPSLNRSNLLNFSISACSPKTGSLPTGRGWSRSFELPQFIDEKIVTECSFGGSGQVQLSSTSFVGTYISIRFMNVPLGWQPLLVSDIRVDLDSLPNIPGLEASTTSPGNCTITRASR